MRGNSVWYFSAYVDRIPRFCLAGEIRKQEEVGFLFFIALFLMSLDMRYARSVKFFFRVTSKT